MNPWFKKDFYLLFIFLVLGVICNLKFLIKMVNYAIKLLEVAVNLEFGANAPANLAKLFNFMFANQMAHRLQI